MIFRHIYLFFCEPVKYEKIKVFGFKLNWKFPKSMHGSKMSTANYLFSKYFHFN